MKQFLFGVSSSIIVAGLLFLISKIFTKKKVIIGDEVSEDEKNKIYNEHIELMKQVYEKNPNIRTKNDVIKELNRYRDNN